ncbi:beta-lactamase-like protein 2 [Actinia tenebrosa]|uniref:Beta-lactamase-like protein 2 n=1 Tax=Actinia tenebrosa TaxID=6105 RepID=A0A6P8IMB2_ACTTE|nr:beta-lactamase-like protein 2 [Actinia tenebrosa]
MYPCASVSKVLTAVMFFKLVNDARVRSLDDKVVRYETSFSVKNPFNNLQITLRELAAHRSGLMREAPCYPIPEGSTNFCPNDYNTMLNRIKNLTLLRSPGSKPQYSNLGYGLLGRVLFHSFSSSGLNFDQWMKNELFFKLNMMNTTFAPSNSQKLKMPVGYLDGTYVNHIYDWGWLQPTGGMFSTVDDLSKLLIELMTNKANNRLLSTSLTEEFFKPDYIFPDSKTIIGTPWEMKQHDGYIIREKAGYIYGYNSYVAMVPEIRLGINMFCTDCQQKLGSSIPNYFTKILSVFKEEFARASAKNFTLPPDSKPFLGQYNSSIPTLKRIHIKEKPGHLTFAVNDYDLFFINSTGPLTFKISVNPAVDCMDAFTMGVENEVIFFDKPSTRNGKSPGFVMFGASVDGRTYFTREN